MLRPGWTDAARSAAALMLAACLATACGTLGGGPAVVAPEADADSGAAVPAPEVQARYAELVARLGAGDAGAATELEQFSAANPALAGPLVNLALLRARAGDAEAAEALLGRAAAVCAHCGAVWNELGVLQRQQGRFAEAEQAYQRAIELEPDYPDAYYNLAILYELYTARPDLALENYERYLALAGEAGDGAEVAQWVADLRRRVNATAKAARAEKTS